MRQTLVAMLIAPVFVPILMLVDLSSYATTREWFQVFAIVATLFAYLGVLVFGAPTLLYIWARNYTGLSSTIAVGIAIGMLTWLVFGVLLSLALGASLFNAIRQTLTWTFLKGLFWPAGICGAVVATAIWFMARPDRRRMRTTE